MQILLKRLSGVTDTFDIPAGWTHAHLYQFVAERDRLPLGGFLLHKGNHNIPNDSSLVQKNEDDGVMYLLLHNNHANGGRKSSSRYSRPISKRRRSSKSRSQSRSRSRGDAIAAVMKAKGMHLGAASAYVKRHGLW